MNQRFYTLAGMVRDLHCPRWTLSGNSYHDNGFTHWPEWLGIDTVGCPVLDSSALADVSISLDAVVDRRSLQINSRLFNSSRDLIRRP